MEQRKRKTTGPPLAELIAKLESDIAAYKAAKNPDTLKCLGESAGAVANTVNPSTPPPPPKP